MTAAKLANVTPIVPEPINRNLGIFTIDVFDDPEYVWLAPVLTVMARFGQLNKGQNGGAYVHTPLVTKYGPGIGKYTIGLYASTGVLEDMSPHVKLTVIAACDTAVHVEINFHKLLDVPDILERKIKAAIQFCHADLMEGPNR